VQKTLRRIVIGGGIVLFVVVLGGAYAYRASQAVPDFYEQALRIEPATQEEAGYEMERQILELHNDTRHVGQWREVFTSEQVNGWLAVDLINKFGKLIPKGVSDPRVAIDEQFFRIACRYKDSRISTIVSITLSIYLTGEPNEMAIRIHGAKAGTLPLPLTKALKNIERVARDNDLPLRWAQEEGDPIALLTIPMQHKELPKPVQIDVLELHDGEIHFGGRTLDAVQTASRNHEKFRGVSYRDEKLIR